MPNGSASTASAPRRTSWRRSRAIRARACSHSLAQNPQLRIRELAAGLDVTERAAQTIVNDLVEAHYLTRTRVGRRNRYTVRTEMPLRHPLLRDVHVGELLDLLNG